MKTKSLLPALIFFLTISHYLFSQTTVSIRLGPETGQDCQIATFQMNSPNPNSTEMVAATWTYNTQFNVWRSLFKFNLSEIPPGAQIISAKLSLYGNPYPISNTHYGLNESYLRKVTSDWNQNTATFLNQPSYTIEGQVSLHQSLYYFQDYPDLDVTELVRQMVFEPSGNFGFIFMNKYEELYKCLNFASGDCILFDKRPKLEIIYNTVGIEPISSEIPVEFKLFQNYPNPFNPETNIKFSIPKNSNVKISVFNELGREVTELLNENLNAGSYAVKWDGLNSNSGTYFVRLITQYKTETIRMVLIK
ncbi:MAG: DNRLRE domain-containing protein [Ignavibacteriae bacterium]|nr:DNRLRE domain-containing protein [Ignavibacteriota bacterium]